MTLLFIITTIFGLLGLCLTVLSQTYIWQRKEYRLDRILSAIKSFEFELATTIYIIITLFTLIGWLDAYTTHIKQADLISLFVLLSINGFFFYRFLNKGIFRPQLTIKSLLVLSTTTPILFFYIFFILISSTSYALRWTTLIVLTPLVITMVVAFINILTNPKKQSIIKQATKLRSDKPNLTVIGITGSFGKTSTKYFASQLIPKATISSDHRNSELSIAQDILQHFNKDISSYIVELGAYCHGEILSLAKLTQPTIGVITAIGNQHLSLFGSQKAILDTKWELIESLPANGIAILNADNELLVKKSKNLPIKIIWYSTKNKADVYIDDVNIKDRYILCNLHIGEISKTIKIPLASRGMLSSAVAAAAIALAHGENINDIFSRIENIKTFPKTMELKTTLMNDTIIDDSYSANEHGVINAISHMSTFSSNDKRIIMVPLIELGADNHKVHQKISTALENSNASVFIYGNSYKKDISSNINVSKIHFISNPKELAKQATQNITKDTVILLEGRIPNTVHHALFKKSNLR
jgi:UDP-N-acetylmuramoyl-tripeptide--D-alanyl-D-alanine ligase